MKHARGKVGPKARAAPLIEDLSLGEATRTRYLNYALSVITSRALPDVRDGLKPVQRRILYAMWRDLRAVSNSRFVKCAAVVGEVMKSYHPHGDQSIYDALVRMAQPFSLRYPLVEGYGNFGSIDGDPPAAMRYTECRLRAIAETLLDDLGFDTVDFRPNYAATEDEPVVLPARLPQLLINGNAGIAVGMATNIPPHNLKEVCQALVALIDHDRDLPMEKLLKHILGPDFPTGGVILNSAEEIREAYAKGQGTIRLRGTYELDPERPGTILVTSIPYGIEKDSLVQRIGELIVKGQVPQLVNVKDLSTEDIRISLELQKGASADAATAYLFKNTPLQTNFSINLTCLLPSDQAEIAIPERLDLRSLLNHFLDFRFQVVTRKLQHELTNIRRRLHILDGFLIVFDHLDEAIRIIRASDGKADAAPKLIKRFSLSEIQADAILETKLYKLGKLEIVELREEHAALSGRAREIEALLGDEPSVWKLIRKELKETANRFQDARKTTISGPVQEVSFSDEDYIVDEDSWVIVTTNGWLKRQKSFVDISSVRIREDDRISWIYRCRARQTLTFFTDRGTAYTLRAHEIPLTTGHGDPIQKSFAFENQERLVGVVCHDPRCLPESKRRDTRKKNTSTTNGSPKGHGPSTANAVLATNGQGDGDSYRLKSPAGPESPPPPYAVAMTAAGKIVRFPLTPFATPSTRKGRTAIRLDSSVAHDHLIGIEVAEEDENVLLVTHLARVLIFPLGEVPVVGGPAKGVTAIRLGPKDHVLGFTLVTKGRDGFAVKTNRGGIHPVKAAKYPTTSRGGKGFSCLQRGSLESIVPEEVTPIPPLEEIQD